MSHDPVNHPEHYTSHPSGVECIQITEHMGFNLGNAIKYIWRADLKGAAIEDLEKAVWYVQREIERRKTVVNEQVDVAFAASPLMQHMRTVGEHLRESLVASFGVPRRIDSVLAMPEVETALGDDPAARENYLRALAKSCIWAAMPAGAAAVSVSPLRVQASARAEPEVQEYLLAHFRELVDEVFGEIAARHDAESRN